MKTMKMFAIMLCGFTVLTACNNTTDQPAEKETVIIKEDNDRDDPVIIEKEEDEGVDFKIGKGDDGKVDVEVEGKVKND